MQLQKIYLNFTICKIKDINDVDFTREFVFVSKTDDEISLVCESSRVPPDVIAAESGWSALKISGILDFGMTGVISKISGILAEEQIGIFVVSTYNTDYILVKTRVLNAAIQALTDNGYIVTYGK